VPNILINGVKSKTGGGKSILQTYLRMANSESSDLRYFVLTPNADEYKVFESDKINIIDIPSFAKSNAFFLLLYHYYFPKIIKEFDIDAILNYGDIIIPGTTPQLYNFDWAYAAYPTGPSWDCLSKSERIFYGLKIYLFKKYLYSATFIMVQTQLLLKRLQDIYGLNNLEVVPNAVSLDNFRNRDEHHFNLPEGRTKLLYITFYYPHKNIEIFIDIARAIKNRNLPYTLVTTLAPEQHPNAARFLNTVETEGLEEIICNIGPVPMHHVAPLFEQCDGLLMPTLLESFSGSYVEAMFHQRPVFTSDMDFARGVCGEAAFYFDPLDATDILATVEQAFSASENIREMVDRGNIQLSTMWGWERVFARTQQLLVRILKPAKNKP
jgi:glycosyltransferase involved in cell wall biosynthesis